MLYLEYYSNFRTKEYFYTYRGEICKIIEDGEHECKIRILRSNDEKIVKRSKLNAQVRCLSLCDKSIVSDIETGERYIRCNSCGKEDWFKGKR